MLAPDCEAEPAMPLLREFGRSGVALWQRGLSGPRRRRHARRRGRARPAELARFARDTQDHDAIDAAALAALEPDLAGRFAAALYYPGRGAHGAGRGAGFLLEEVRRAGAEVAFGASGTPSETARRSSTAVVLRRRDSLPDLRGVRGERIIVRTREIALRRPVRLLHPRHPLYIVPWGDGRYMVGATVIESEDAGPVTVRSALELLGRAYAVHPAFAEAEIVDLGAGVRPGFPDNVPRVVVREEGRRIFVNGAYRHGFLLAPVLAGAVADYLATGATMPWLRVEA